MSLADTAFITAVGESKTPTPVRRGRRGSGAWRIAVLLVLGLYFVAPILGAVAAPVPPTRWLW